MIKSNLPDSRTAAPFPLNPPNTLQSSLQIGTVIAVSDLGQIRILTCETKQGDRRYYQAQLIERCAPGQGAGEAFWIEPFGLVQIV